MCDPYGGIIQVEPFQILSLMGAVLILIAYTANQMGRLALLTLPYQILNFVGGAALLATAIVETQYGFMLMEGAWTIISFFGLINVMRKRRAANS